MDDTRTDFDKKNANSKGFTIDPKTGKQTSLKNKSGNLDKASQTARTMPH